MLLGYQTYQYMLSVYIVSINVGNILCILSLNNFSYTKFIFCASCLYCDLFVILHTCTSKLNLKLLTSCFWDRILKCLPNFKVQFTQITNSHSPTYPRVFCYADKFSFAQL